MQSGPPQLSATASPARPAVSVPATSTPGTNGTTVITRISEGSKIVLIGDETALPAIARRLEEMPAGMRAVAIIAVDSAAEEQPLATAARNSRFPTPAPLLSSTAG